MTTPSLSARRVESVSSIAASAWDALSAPDDPFASHAFLSVLEESGSVGPRTGWEPCPIIVEREGALVGALPLYRKLHSYGEYIFDFAWAAAAERARIRYYPKLVAMAPFTPATGTRFLVTSGEDEAGVVAAILDAVRVAVEDDRASSAHLLFLSEHERERSSASPDFLPRLSHQYHFRNDGYRDFDDLLSRFRSEARKQIKRERRIVSESGLRIATKTGAELEPRDWNAIASFYADTCSRKGSQRYLHRSFFELAAERLRESAVAVIAYDGERPVAMSLAFEKGQAIFGRYWGASADYDRLHFELCYYQLVDRTIARGLSRFEAGAQGEHKIKRGFLPAEVHSSHFVANPMLRAAIASFLPREAEGVDEAMRELAVLSPFRREG